MALHSSLNKQPDKDRSATPLDVSLSITKASQQLICEQLQADYSAFSMPDFRLRFEFIDLAYAMESSEHLKTTRANRIITTIYKELELPVMQPNIDAAWAHLVAIFLAERPIFGTVSIDKEKTPVAKQVEAIVAENSTATGWARQLAMTLKNALKYNIASADVEWVTEEGFNFTTDTNVSFEEAVVDSTLRSGNEVTNNDPYNTFYDMTVAAGDLTKKGDFAGHVDRITLTFLHDYIAGLNANRGIVLNIDQELWKSSPKRNWYYEPQILNEDGTVNSGTNWATFFSNTPNAGGPMTINSQATYERVIYYRKLIPEMLGIRIADAKKVQIWKFVEINGIIIYAERKTNAHKMLPMIMFQPNEDNLRHQTKGLGAQMQPYQQLSSTMFRARIASLARALSDRGLFDPSRVSEKNINSVLPTAKIPILPSAYGKELKDAYLPIPYDDRNAANLYNDIAFVDQKANDAAHTNKAQKGQFTKGNRTQAEFDNIMGNADAPQQAMALILEYQAFVPMKLQIKWNILQYQNIANIADPNTNELVAIDPVALRKEAVNLKMSDGLVTKDELMGVRETLEATQFLAQFPQANIDYDIVGMTAEALGSGANSRIGKWKRSPEEIDSIQKREVAQAGAVAQAENQQAAPAN